MPDSTSITKSIEILLFGGRGSGQNGEKSLESDISAPSKDMKVRFGTKPFLTMRNNYKKNSEKVLLIRGLSLD